jgi:hypothetical protein
MIKKKILFVNGIWDMVELKGNGNIYSIAMAIKLKVIIFALKYEQLVNAFDGLG